MIVPIKENITLENVKKSKYWDLISILVWNHYAEKKFQDESMIEIKESYCGKSINGSSIMFSSDWNNPDYTEDGYERTLNAIKIIFTRSDYITYISITTNGRVHTNGIYTDKTKTTQPHYSGAQRSIDITNWLLENKFVEYKSNDHSKICDEYKDMDNMMKYTLQYCKMNKVAIVIESEYELQCFKDMTNTSPISHYYIDIAVTVHNTWSNSEYYIKKGYEIISFQQFKDSNSKDENNDCEFKENSYE